MSKEGLKSDQTDRREMGDYQARSDECRRLAAQWPEYRLTYLLMAKAWDMAGEKRAVSKEVKALLSPQRPSLPHRSPRRMPGAGGERGKFGE
jgi:hypothetical protein